MARKYLEETPQKVFYLKEESAGSRPRTIARVIIDSLGASIEVDHRQVWLSWDELEAIVKARPRDSA